MVVFGLLSLSVIGDGHTNAIGTAIFVVAVLALGVAMPTAMVIWGRALGVHVGQAGIVSIGPKDAEVFAWRVIRGFSVGDHPRSGGLVVFVELDDGTRKPLAPLMTYRSRRAALERIAAALTHDLDAHRASPSSPDARFQAPFGWRRRVAKMGRIAQRAAPSVTESA